jgi:hypothetical protein
VAPHQRQDLPHEPRAKADLPARPSARWAGKGGQQSLQLSTDVNAISIMLPLMLPLSVGVAVLLGGCSHRAALSDAGGGDEAINAFPANYKPDLLGAMHAYLKDPTGIREAAISEPALKTLDGVKRYVVCLRFNARKSVRDYVGLKEIAAVFIAGRFDRFVEQKSAEHEECGGVAYAPFPELEKLSR